MARSCILIVLQNVRRIIGRELIFRSGPLLVPRESILQLLKCWDLDRFSQVGGRPRGLNSSYCLSKASLSLPRVGITVTSLTRRFILEGGLRLPFNRRLSPAALRNGRR